MTPRVFWTYLRYVLRHKWYVLLEGRRLPSPCGWWQLLVHDLSKFSRREFGAYARHFYAGKDGGRRKRDEDPAFDYAWLNHVHKNPHHWDHWQVRRGAELVALRMPERFVREMAADWLALARQFRQPPTRWYGHHKDTISLHPQTRSRVETLIGWTASDVTAIATVSRL